MKRLIIIPKNKEKGSITLFVLIGCIFILIILLLVNVGLINNKANHEKQIDEISKIYSVNENDLEQAYQTVSANTKDYMSRDEVEELIQQKIDDSKSGLEDKITNLENKINTLNNSAIVEFSSNENGSYVRWENGIQICWFTKNTTNQSMTTAYGSLYAGLYTWTFPAKFATTTNLVIIGGTCKYGTGAPWNNAMPGTALDKASFYLMDVASRPSGTLVSLSGAAIGFWK